MRTLHLALLATLLGTGALPCAATAAPQDKLAAEIAIDGPIGPATARYVKDALKTAARRGAEAVVLRLNTPGGLADSMREIITDVIASPVPVIGYVAPSGAHAASAGTYILYATNIAAMAPGTNLGAATPVEIGGSVPGLPSEEHKDSGAGKDTMAMKVTNDAVALIRGLAELRGRNADWAEKAVREAASLSANAALDAHVIDLMARDTSDLLAQVDGRKVDTPAGARTLATKGARIEEIKPSRFLELLGIITNPNVALILMMIGIYGLIFEFWSPGAVAPGTIGAICLLLGLYALDLLPIDYAGLALMLLGIGLLIAEAFNPTAVLGLGGVAAFLIGASMLLRNAGPGFTLSWSVVGPAGALLLGLMLLTGRYVWSMHRRPVRIGAEAMRGVEARILDWSGGEGHVLAQGERWQALGQESFMPGDAAEVAEVKGLVLTVRHKRRSDEGKLQ